MGVDIALFMEVRHKNKWRPVIWQTPMELKRWHDEDDACKDWNNHMSIYTCRYYHFSDFLEDYAINGLPDDVSPELKSKADEWECSMGYFSFTHLSHFCEMKRKEMLANMSRSVECQMIKQLNRIERYVKQKPIVKTQQPDDDYYSSMSIKQIFEDYENEFFLFEYVRQIVNFLSFEGDIHADSDDIRILYCIC